MRADILLVSALIGVLFAGCSNQDPTPDLPTTESVPTSLLVPESSQLDVALTTDGVVPASLGPLNVTEALPLAARGVATIPVGSRATLLRIDGRAYDEDNGHNAELTLAGAFVDASQRILPEAPGSWVLSRIYFADAGRLAAAGEIRHLQYGQLAVANDVPTWAVVHGPSLDFPDAEGLHEMDLYVLVAFQPPPDAAHVALALGWGGGFNDVNISFEEAIAALASRDDVRIVPLPAHSATASLCYFANRDDPFMTGRIKRGDHGWEIQDEAVLQAPQTIQVDRTFLASCRHDAVEKGLGESVVLVTGSTGRGRWDYTAMADGQTRQGGADLPNLRAAVEFGAIVKWYWARSAAANVSTEHIIDVELVADPEIGSNAESAGMLLYSFQTGLDLDALGLTFQDVLTPAPT